MASSSKTMRQCSRCPTSFMTAFAGKHPTCRQCSPTKPREGPVAYRPGRFAGGGTTTLRHEVDKVKRVEIIREQVARARPSRDIVICMDTSRSMSGCKLAAAVAGVRAITDEGTIAGDVRTTPPMDRFPAFCIHEYSLSSQS